MSISSSIIDPLLNLHGAAAYALVGSLAFAEAALFVGFVLPGETAVVLGGVLAYQHAVLLPVMSAVVVVAAIGGDSVGYEVGKNYGEKLLTLRIFARHQDAIAKGREKLQIKGGVAVLLSRFTAFLRAVMPGMAGLSRMPYRKFIVWNAAGGIIWGIGFTLLGYLAGASYKRIEGYAGNLSYIILAVAGIAAVVLVVRRRLRERDERVRASDESSRSPGDA